MGVSKIAISLDKRLLKQLDELIDQEHFQNRSHAIQCLLSEKITILHHTRLAKECENLDAHAEQQLAEEGFNKDISEWPEF